MSAPHGVPLSILDLSPVSAGSSPQQAIRNTIDLARHAESWGYRRFWVAEHHFVQVAASATTTLIGLIAAATSTIRVGSAAVQLGHHTSASVVESFGTSTRCIRAASIWAWADPATGPTGSGRPALRPRRSVPPRCGAGW